MDDDDVEKLKWIVYLIVLVTFLGAIFNIPSPLTNFVVQWLIGAFVGSVFSFVAGAIVEGFTGDWMKTITLTFSIGDFEFSITVFAIVTFIVKVKLFGF